MAPRPAAAGMVLPAVSPHWADVILPIWADQWQRGKALDDVLARPWTSETLKQFLQNEPRRHDNFVTLEGVAQRAHLRAGGILVSPESE